MLSFPTRKRWRCKGIAGLSRQVHSSDLAKALQLSSEALKVEPFRWRRGMLFGRSFSMVYCFRLLRTSFKAAPILALACPSTDATAVSRWCAAVKSPNPKPINRLETSLNIRILHTSHSCHSGRRNKPLSAPIRYIGRSIERIPHAKHAARQVILKAAHSRPSAAHMHFHQQSRKVSSTSSQCPRAHITAHEAPATPAHPTHATQEINCAQLRPSASTRARGPLSTKPNRFKPPCSAIGSRLAQRPRVGLYARYSYSTKSVVGSVRFVENRKEFRVAAGPVRRIGSPKGPYS